MKILAMDTSTMTTTVGLIDEGTILGEFTLRGQISHSEALVDMVSNIFNKMDFNIENIDLFAVGIGPGSFTGLRIGMSVAKTFAQVFDKDIVGCSSLEALIYNTSREGIYVPVIDARRNKVYRGIYERTDEGVICHREDGLIDLEELASELTHFDKVTFIGDGVDTLKEKLMEICNGQCIFLPSNLSRMKGSSLCVLAQKLYNEGKRDSYYDLIPNYANESQAQREYKDGNTKS